MGDRRRRLDKILLQGRLSLRETHPRRVEILTRTRGKARAILLLLLLLTLCEEHAELASLRRILSLKDALEHLIVDRGLRTLGD